VANQSVEIPLEVNVSTADPNETVKSIDRIPAFVSSSLLSSNPPPGELDHTQNNGIYQESGITNQQLMTVSALGGNYNYITEDGQNIQVSDATIPDPYSNAPMRTVSIDGKTIDYIPSHGLESIQSIYGQYDDMIMTDVNPIGMKILANQTGVITAGTGGTSWNARTSTGSFSNGWKSVTYGNGIFVAVARTVSTTGAVQTSSDGITWTAQTSTSGTGSGWQSVTYGNGIFVAVSDSNSTSGAVMTSPDGINWTNRPTVGSAASGNGWYSVIYGNGIFVAVANSTSTSGAVMTSPDGINWTTRPTVGSAASGSGWVSVTYGNTLFVAVAQSTSTSGAVMTSPDGINWTTRPTVGSAASGIGWNSVTYGNNLFVAVASSTSTSGSIMTSPNGTSWTLQTSVAAFASGWSSVIYGNGVFVAVAYTTSTIRAIQTSTNGSSWSVQTSTAASGNGWYSVAYGNGVFVAIADSTLTAGVIQTSVVTYTSQLQVRIDEIASTGTVANTVTRTFTSVGYAQPVCLVRQALGQATPFTWASTQYILAADASTANFNVFSDAGTAQLTTGKIVTANWASGTPKYIWCAKMVGKTEYVSVAQGGTGNATAFSTATVLTMSSYCWAVMQSKNTYNRVILSGQTNVATTSNYLGISGYNVFSATYQLVPTGNTVDGTTEGIGSSGYAYVDIYRTTTPNHYYSSYNDPATTGALAVANGLFVAKGTSQGQIRGFGRVSWISYADNGNVKPAFEFRVMYAPYYTVTNGAVTTASTTSIAVGISVATCYDGTGGAINGIPAGVPITTYGEFDPTFAPQLSSTFDSIMWRYNGVYYIAKVSINPIRPIQKISSRLYKLNTISPVNVIDSVSRTLNLGSNDYHGGAVLTGGGTATTGLINFMAYGAYANSVDTKLMGITVNAYTDGSQTPVGYTQPSVHTSFGYYPIYKYWNTGTSFGNIILDSSARPITSTSLTTALFSSVNIYPFYVQNSTIPIPLGLNWSGRSIGTNSSATTYSFQETFITGGYVGGATTVTSDYDGYIIGNAIPANGITFTLFSTNYFFDGRSIFQISFNGAYVQFPLQKAVTADGLQFIAQSQDKAFFLSAFDNSIYIFDGGRSLYKMRKFTLNGAITQGVFNVRDNTLMLDATTQWIWMRDGIISFDTKNANQIGSALSFYDTTKGIYIGNNFQLYQYGYSQSQIFVPTSLTGSKAVVPLDFQTAYYGMGANKISLELSYYVTVFNASKAKTALNVTIYGFNQDEQKGFVNQNPQKSVVNINPADYDDAGYFRFSVTPRYSKVLASSIGIECATKIAVVEVMLRYDDASIEAVYAPNRRART